MKTIPVINILSFRIANTDIFALSMLLILIIILIISYMVLKKARELVEQNMSPADREKLRLYKLHQKEKGLSTWDKLMGLRPIAEEKDMTLDHDFDGISELDNPTPTWFKILFYGTILIGIGYFVNYHVLGYGLLQDDEYKMEMKKADEDKLAFIKSAGAKAMINENNVTVTKDKGMIAKGEVIFKSTCAPCHGDKGQGIVGPNLTDAYWIHGGDIKNIFKTIKYGVPDKGMVAWEKSLGAQQIADVANYILTLQGTNPAGAKAPQGNKE